MAVVIENVRFADQQMFGGQPVTWPYGQIEDLVDVIVDFKVESFSIDIDDEQEITARPAVSPHIPDTTRLLQADFEAFTDFLVLDSLEIVGTASNDGTYQIVEKLDEDGVILDQDLVNESFPSGAYIQLATPYRGIRFRWNWVGNEDPTTFNSVINGEEQRYETNNADANTPVSVNMIAKGKNEYKFGSAIISGRGISGGSQKFRLIQSGMILPSFLAGQYEDLKNGILPPWYLDGNCLKHVLEIEANHELADPNRTQTVIHDQTLGNTGGFNESFNGGQTAYSISNKQIQRVSDSEILEKIDLQAPCTLTFDVDNPNGVFVDGSSKAHIKFTYLPSQEVFYQNNGNNYVENFYQDRAIVTTGGSSPGSNFGTDQQVITNFAVAFVSSNKIRCTVTVDCATAMQDILLPRDTPQYRFMVTVANHAITYAQSDKATLIVDVNEFFIKLVDTDIINSVSDAFIQHPHINSDLSDPLIALPVDDIVSEQKISIDFTGKTEQGIIIKSLTTEIVAKSAGNPEILLESNVIDTSNFPLLDGYVQEITAIQDRGFKIPDDEIRRKISLKRNTTADVGNIRNWIVQYGFMQRWDEWNEVLGITNPVTGIYDPAEPFNGFNHDWYRYTTIAGYQLNARHSFLIEQNGQNFVQTFDFPYSSRTFLANPNWINEAIEIWDPDLPVPAQNIVFGEFVIRGTSDSPVKIKFTWAGAGAAPAENEVSMVLWLGVRTQNDPQNIFRSSSVYNKSSFSWIKEDKITITKTGNDYLGECTLDYLKLPGERYITAYARIYEPNSPVPLDAKTMAPSDDPKTVTGGDFKTTAP